MRTLYAFAVREYKMASSAGWTWAQGSLSNRLLIAHDLWGGVWGRGLRNRRPEGGQREARPLIGIFLRIIRIFLGIIRICLGIVRIFLGIIRIFLRIIRILLGIIRIFLGIIGIFPGIIRNS